MQGFYTRPGGGSAALTSLNTGAPYVVRLGAYWLYKHES
jgi:hypothetical protein